MLSIFLCCLCNTLFSFHVKVLLQSVTYEELRACPWEIASENGFVIYDDLDTDVGTYCNQNSIKIGAKNKGLSLQGKSTYKDTLYVYPQLSADYLFTLLEFVHTKISAQQMIDLGENEWGFDVLMDFAPHQKGYTYIQAECLRVCHEVLQAFYERMQPEPPVAFEVLEKQLSRYIQAKMWKECLLAYQSLKLQYKDLKRLKKHLTFVKEKIFSVIDQASENLMYSFFSQLPQYILRSFFQEECGHLSVNGLDYLGSLMIAIEDEKILLINSVSMDDYLVGVLRSEGWPGWSLETNKVLAIAVRTYVIARIVQARAQKLPYHIKNSIHHQKYDGHRKKNKQDLILYEAVKETHNIFLGYKGKPIDAMFDSCCGGIIPAKMTGYDFVKAPYLARKKECTWCKSSWIYNWSAPYSRDELKKTLEKNGIVCKRIDDVQIAGYDKAGLVTKVAFISGKEKIYVSVKKMYSIFSNIKSFCFTVKKQNENFVFQGKGYGHHIGLCQWGAMNMVKQGHDFKRVLEFYYPGATFMRFVPEE